MIIFIKKLLTSNAAWLKQDKSILHARPPKPHAYTTLPLKNKIPFFSAKLFAKLIIGLVVCINFKISLFFILDIFDLKILSPIIIGLCASLTYLIRNMYYERDTTRYAFWLSFIIPTLISVLFLMFSFYLLPVLLPILIGWTVTHEGSLLMHLDAPKDSGEGSSKNIGESSSSKSNKNPDQKISTEQELLELANRANEINQKIYEKYLEIGKNIKGIKQSSDFSPESQDIFESADNRFKEAEKQTSEKLNPSSNAHGNIHENDRLIRVYVETTNVTLKEILDSPATTQEDKSIAQTAQDDLSNLEENRKQLKDIRTNIRKQKDK